MSWSSDPWLLVQRPQVRGRHFCLHVVWDNTWARRRSPCPVPLLQIASHAKESSWKPAGLGVYGWAFAGCLAASHQGGLTTSQLQLNSPALAVQRNADLRTTGNTGGHLSLLFLPHLWLPHLMGFLLSQLPGL